MTDTAAIGYPDAARHLGVSLRVLRHAIRAGRIPAPPSNVATARLPAEWLKQAEAAVAKEPRALNRSFTQKVPPFARYQGTSAWHKYRVRVHAYAEFRAQIAAA